MSRYKFRIVLIFFVIGVYSIVGAEESDRPVKRPWLDLNLEPKNSSEAPEEIIIADQNVGTSAQIPEADSSRVYDRVRQLNMENWFKRSGQIWVELRSDQNTSSGHWKMLCVEMIQEWKKRKGPLSKITCSYILYTSGKEKSYRRMWFKELKEKIKGQRSSEAPDLLLCHCSYVRGDNIRGKRNSKYFGVKPYRSNEYFLLPRRPSRSNSVYEVYNIHTLKIDNNSSSQAVQDKIEKLCSS